MISGFYGMLKNLECFQHKPFFFNNFQSNKSLHSK